MLMGWLATVQAGGSDVVRAADAAEARALEANLPMSVVEA